MEIGLIHILDENYEDYKNTTLNINFHEAETRRLFGVKALNDKIVVGAVQDSDRVVPNVRIPLRIRRHFKV